MVVRNLTDLAFEDLVLCFLKSFKNYYVEMPTDVDYYRNRFKAAKVRYDLSYGMFDNDQLVGFIVHGIDRRNGDYIAYNTGTGVIPEFRGRRIVKAIYDHAIEDLKKHGITLCSLEVIKENEIALKSYQKIGFEICRGYKCYNGSLKHLTDESFQMREIEHDKLNWDRLPNQGHYSWDNHKNSLKIGKSRYYLVSKNGRNIAYFTMIPENGYLAQFDVLDKSELSWQLLFQAIRSVNKKIKINNVDEELKERCAYLEKLGLENKIDQFEMQMRI